MKFSQLVRSGKNRRRPPKSALRIELLEGRSLMAADVLPVLMVIADQQDFYYQEYGDTRIGLEAEGLTVEVAARTTNPSRPHVGTGEPAGTDGTVVPDIALADVNEDDYSAIVFVGGWGSSMYQYAFEGTYSNSHYNGDLATKEIVNDLINDFVDADKHVAAVCHGVTVLAWARVDGVSPLDGKEIAVPFIGSPAVVWQGQFYGHFELQQSPQVSQNGGTPSAYSGARGADTSPGSVHDDVVVDGRIITAENYDSALAFGQIIAQEVLAANVLPPVPELPPAPPENQVPLMENQTFSLQENSAAGTIAGTVLASDADAGQTLTYAISSGNTNNAFAINPATGQLSVANFAALDFETTPIFNLTVTATDNGTPAASTEAEITVNLIDVPEAPPPGVSFNGTNLRVQGTSGTDYIYLWSGRSDSQIFVWMAGSTSGPFNIPAGGHVRVFGGSGNDYIYATDARFSVEIYGEDGHDVITGGSANDILDGGAGTDRISGNGGNDIIRGGLGRDYLYGNDGDDIILGGAGDDVIEGHAGHDFLIGGLGLDYQKGGDGDDVLIGGTTAFDDDNAMLLALHSLWSTTGSISERADRLQLVGNDLGLIGGTTVFDDQQADIMCSGNGADLVFAGMGDWFYGDDDDLGR